MKRSDVAVAGLLIGFAGFIFLEGRRLPLGSLRVPQTGFFPSILAALLALFAGALLFQAWRTADSAGGAETLEPRSWVRIGAALAAMAFFALALESAGFFLTTFLLMTLLLRAIEAQRWSKVIPIALATALVSYAIFGMLLGIPLPAGFLGI
jgi:putative tricarboxylic transport membrane protein